jgi:hypothetical protein
MSDLTDSDLYVPHYYDVLRVPIKDDSSTGYLIHEIKPSNNNQSGLNNENSSTITFDYKGDSKCIRLHPYRCGFRVQGAFRTKSAKADGETSNNSKDANITLSSNWFWHLFSTYKLKVANKDDVENLANPGIFVDTMGLFKGSEYKNTYGELNGYIPDEGNGEADDLLDITGTCSISKSHLAAISAATNDEGAGTRAFNIAVNKTNWTNYNRGFQRRKAKYNYTTTDMTDGTVRHFEEFIPLSQVSGFFSTDTCLMNTNFTIELTRKPNINYKNSFFGSGTTHVDFGNTQDTGLTSIVLELLEQKPNLQQESKLVSTFNNTDKIPKPIAFLKGSVTGAYQIKELNEYNISVNTFNVPRYVILLFKGCNNPANTTAANNLANQANDCNKNFSLNAHADMESIQVDINGQQFPNKLQNANIVDKNSFSAFYQQYVSLCTRLEEDPCLTMNEFRDLYFVAAFDCSDQVKKESTQTTNLQVNIKRREMKEPKNNDNRKNPQFIEGYMIVLEDKFLKIDAKSNNCSVYSQIG